MWCFSQSYKLAQKYRNGCNSDVSQLSTFNRMDNRSNQPNEVGNAFRNFVGRDVVRKGAKPTLESWIWQQKLLQNEAIGR